MQKQSDIIKQLSDKQLKYQLLLSQCLLLILSGFLSFIFFDSIQDWNWYFHFNTKEITIYGIAGGLIIVLFDLFTWHVFPERWYDDGGINKRIFKNRTIGDIFVIVIIVSIAEELLFRGALQTTFGYIVASTLFALIHIRYLSKPLLFISALLMSFYIGWIFEETENLLVTITTHFIVDFLLALMIRNQKWGESS